MSLPRVEIWTDGSCPQNPGPGGWAAILIFRHPGKEPVIRELSGGNPNTTNNEMEFEAALQGLSALVRSCYVTIHTDSQLLIGYMCNGWNGKVRHLVEIRNEIGRLCKRMGHVVSYVKVRGHAGVHYNERADTLARAAVPNKGEQT